jgi:hypothetical protein
MAASLTASTTHITIRLRHARWCRDERHASDLQEPRSFFGVLRIHRITRPQSSPQCRQLEEAPIAFRDDVGTARGGKQHARVCHRDEGELAFA